ncbi:hypothetical protein KO507_07995 [Gilvimarinus agarilyticus]|uniref:ApeP family dehydratase n=1 Tax=Gilvimarinus sp. 2_MG-2023 TaxID=3062666 RepID=UPI001C0A09B0|nr:hypothetical protein [Gilvimarinus sp. 2_MG-2023]MBU2885700.1 hypothetical protein [Gilvimarinus agarilyticus]MDO6570560.1 hypothetical protein [Gilvimarinus sp. 2_MG-2023]
MNLDTLIPHRPPFRLIDQVLDHAPDWVLTGATIEQDNALYDAARGGVPAWCSVEYMAQTAAVWVGLSESAAEAAQPAFLISARSVQSSVASFSLGAMLQVRVDVNLIDGPIVAFHGKITQCVNDEWQTVSEGEFSAFRPDSLEDYLRLSDPQHVAQAGQGAL